MNEEMIEQLTNKILAVEKNNNNEMIVACKNVVAFLQNKEEQKHFILMRQLQLDHFLQLISPNNKKDILS